MILCAPNPDANAQIPKEWYLGLKIISIILVSLNFDPFVCHWIGIFSSILYSYNSITKEANQMKKNLARYASNILATSAVVFATILKPALYSPEVPKELRK